MNKKVVAQLKLPNMSNITQKWVDLLIPFSDKYSSKFSISELSRKSKIPQQTASRILNNLVKLNLIRYKIKGKNKEYYFDLGNPRTKIIFQIIESVKSLNFSFINPRIFVLIQKIIEEREVVIFGSYAKGNYTKESDVDLLIIGTKSEKIKKQFRGEMKEINIHFSTIKEFEKLLLKKQNLALEILENHIIFGGTQFIELCWRHYKNG